VEKHESPLARLLAERLEREAARPDDAGHVLLEAGADVPLPRLRRREVDRRVQPGHVHGLAGADPAHLVPRRDERRLERRSDLPAMP